MRQATKTLALSTSGKGFYEITSEITAWLDGLDFQTGLLTVFLQHTSASLLIQENADPDVVRNLETFFSRLVPEDSRLYTHTLEGGDDMPAHIRAALTQTQLSIPIVHGRLALGAWQGVYLYEHRARAHRRNVVLHAAGD